LRHSRSSSDLLMRIAKSTNKLTDDCSAAGLNLQENQVTL
jgi:hypothetical protein